MNGLQAQYEDERSCGSLRMEQLDALKTLKDESRIVGRAEGFCT
jgi:hypothetical protein